MTDSPSQGKDRPSLSPEQFDAVAQRFMERVRWNRELNISLTGLERGVAEMELPYDPRFVGDPETGVLHGGVVTAMLDACSGAAVMCHPTAPLATATLDLRIDYMRPAAPHRTVYARAECYKATRHVAFVRSLAHDGDPSDPVAASSGAFTLERGGNHLSDAARKEAEDVLAAMKEKGEGA